MKKSAWIFAFIGLAISACTTQKQASSYVNDDVYGAPSSSAAVKPATPPPAASGVQVVTSPDNASVSKPGSSTFADDYNDYSYSSRISRFNNADTTKGYFNDSYTTSDIPSDGSGSDPNVNIYLGYGGGYGSSFGFSYGYPYSSWGWDYGWYPYSSWGWYNSWAWGYPYYGYNPWYSSCCYCYGYNDWYYGGYPPYYATNTYYGPRQSLYRSDIGSSLPNNRNSQEIAPGTLSPNSRNQQSAINSRTGNSMEGNMQPTPRSTPASQEKYRYTRAGNNRQAPNQRTTEKTRQQSPTGRANPAPKYVRPENAAAIQRSGSTQSYSSPTYRQPKTSQEYLTPRAQTQGSGRVSNGESRTTGNPGSSAIDNRRTSPSTGIERSQNNNSRTRSSGEVSPVRSSISQPSRSGSNSGTYTAPRRSENSGSYSAPVRSGGSGTSSPSGGSNYSAPTRSGGSGGSTPSSGGGGGRRR